MNRNSIFNKIFRILFFFACGAILLIHSHVSNVKYNKTEELIKRCVIKVEAPIYNVEYIEETERDDNGNEYTSNEYHRVFFTYEVKGNEYSGNYKASTIYEKGDTFTIYCNPDNPNEWITQTDINMQDYILDDDIKGFRELGIASIFIGVFFMVFYIIKGMLGKSKRTNNKKETNLPK